MTLSKNVKNTLGGYKTDSMKLKFNVLESPPLIQVKEYSVISGAMSFSIGEPSMVPGKSS